MRNSFWAYLIAIAVGGISLFFKAAVPEQPWLAPALFYLAIVIASLATLGLAHNMGVWRRVAARTRRSPLAAGTQPADGKTTTSAAARVQVPRPAGPVGPVPVLQKQPKNVTGDTPAEVRGKSPKGPVNVE